MSRYRFSNGNKLRSIYCDEALWNDISAMAASKNMSRGAYIRLASRLTIERERAVH